MGGGGYCQRLDHSGQLTELGGDAVTLTGEERDFGACVLDDTACPRPALGGRVAGLRDGPRPPPGGPPPPVRRRGPPWGEPFCGPPPPPPRPPRRPPPPGRG